jgi:curved DNA-binding protein CbpA
MKLTAEQKNYFNILDTEPTWDLGVLKQHYRILAKKYHPDQKNYEEAVCDEKMSTINHAYDRLTDFINTIKFHKNETKQKDNSTVLKYYTDIVQIRELISKYLFRLKKARKKMLIITKKGIVEPVLNKLFDYRDIILDQSVRNSFTDDFLLPYLEISQKLEQFLEVIFIDTRKKQIASYVQKKAKFLSELILQDINELNTEYPDTKWAHEARRFKKLISLTLYHFNFILDCLQYYYRNTFI